MIFNLREVIGGALGAAGLQTTSDVWQLAEVWSSTLGARIASKAAPVGLTRGELVVAVAESVWRQELALLAPDIAARLNHALGREVVKRIRLVGGDASMSASGAAERTRRRLSSTASAVPEGVAAQRPIGTATAITSDVEAALRSLAAKRAERIVSDDASRARGATPSAQAPARRRW